MDWNELLDRLGDLTAARFEEVLARARVPPQYLPAQSAPQIMRAIEAMRYLERERALHRLASLLEGRAPARGTGSVTPLPEIEREYLAWAEREFASLPNPLRIGGQSFDVPLDSVFVSLRAFPGTNAEIQQSIDVDDEPTVWQERDRQPQFAPRASESVSLHEALCKHRAAIVLGEPGSGKTTLARWLTLIFARARREQRSHVEVHDGRLTAMHRGSDRTTQLGTARLPIFVPVSAIAEEYRRRSGRATLTDLLVQGPLQRCPAYAFDADRKGEPIDPDELSRLFKRALAEQRAVIFLDGLDEIANGAERKDIVKLIHDFLHIHLASQDSPDESNQLFVTSRIVGYQDYPLRDSVARFTVEPMSARAIAAFSDAWHAALGAKLAHDGASPQPTAQQASEVFQRQLHQPAHRALRELAANPFMLSTLLIMSYENRQVLPSSRSRLYAQLVERALSSLFFDKNERLYGPLRAALDEILTDVAEQIHVTSSTGLVEKTKLAAMIWSVVQTKPVAAAELSSEGAAFELIVKQMGLWVERGTGRYGFRHLTVQEYLVGKQLVRSAQCSAETLIHRSMDPRWHEAVLLGVGFLCESMPRETVQRVCDALLRSGQGSIPNGAIILGKVVRERARVPAKIVGATASVLLAACGRANLTRAQPAFAPFVERLLAGVLTDPSYDPAWIAEVSRVCTQFAEADALDKVVALAHLISAQKLALTSCAEPLLGQLHRDSPELGWILHRSIETIAMAPDLTVARLQPADPALVAQLSEATRKLLHDRSVVEHIEFTRGAELPAGSDDARGLPAYLMPIREVFEQSPELVIQVRDDLRWLQRIVMLYGGLGEFESRLLDDDLSAQVAMLGAAAIDAQSQERAVRDMDTNRQPMRDRARARKTTFEPRWISRDSPLTPLIERWLAANAPADEVDRALRELWDEDDARGCRPLAERFRGTPMGAQLTAADAIELTLSDCLAALIAGGALDRIPDASRSALHEGALRRLDAHLHRIRLAQRDPLTRMRSQLEEFLMRGARTLAATTAQRVAGLIDPVCAEGFAWAADRAERARQLGDVLRQLLQAGEHAEARCDALFDVHDSAMVQDGAALRALTSLLDSTLRPFDERFTIADACWGAALGRTDFCALLALSTLPPALDRCKAALLLFFALAEVPAWRPLVLALTLSLRSDRLRDAVLRRMQLTGHDRAELVALALDGVTSFWANHPVEAFHALRCLLDRDAIGDEARRQALLRLAADMPGTELRVAALAHVMQLLAGWPEASVARQQLVDALATRDRSVPRPAPRRYAARTATPEELDFARACEELVVLGGQLGVEPPKALLAIEHVQPPVRTALLVQYWRFLFLPYNEDHEYNIAVALDAFGKQLDVPPDELIASFARSIHLIEQYRRDGIQLVPVSPSGAERDEILDALLFLHLGPAAFEPLRAWALSRIIPYLQLVAPDYIPLAACVASERVSALRGVGLRDLARHWRDLVPHEFFEAIRAETRTIRDPVVRFYTLSVLARRGVAGISATTLLEAATTIADPVARADAMISLAFQCASAGHLPGVDPPAASMAIAPDTSCAPHAELRRAGRWKVARWIAANHAAAEPGERAALASAAVCLSAAALLGDGLAGGGLSAIELLRAGADAQQLIRPMTVQRPVSVFALDGQATAQLQAMLDDPARRGSLTHLLPLITDAGAADMLALEAWRLRYPEPAIAGWAALMLAERGQWSSDIARTVIALLGHPDDLLRGRASFALTMLDGHDRYLRASALGEDCVRTLASSLADREGRTCGARNVLVWAFEHIVIDIPGLISRLAEEVIATGSEQALTLLRRVHRLSGPASEEMLALLAADAPSKLRRAVLGAALGLWTYAWLGWSDSGSLARIKHRLWCDLHSSDVGVARLAGEMLGRIAARDDVVEAVRMIGEQKLPAARGLRMLAINARRQGPILALLRDPACASLIGLIESRDAATAIATGELLLRAGWPADDVRRRIKEGERFARACFASVDWPFADRSHLRQVRIVARAISRLAGEELEHTELSDRNPIVLALQLADRTMEAGRIAMRIQDEPCTQLVNILPVCAAVAELSPDLYRRVAAEYLPDDFPRKLQIAATDADGFPTRQAALVLLGLLRTFSPALGHAMRAATADVYAVQNTAVEQLDRIERVDGDALEGLHALLTSDSANVSYTAARMLLHAIKSPRLAGDEREVLKDRIRPWLRDAASAAHPARVIALLEQSEERWTPRMRIVGTLRDFLERATLELDAIHLDREAAGAASDGEDSAHLRAWVMAHGEPKLVDLFLGPRAVANNPVQYQGRWLNVMFDATIPSPLTVALVDVASVAAKAGASVAELLVMAYQSSEPERAAPDSKDTP